MIVNPLSQSRRVLGAMAFLSSLVLVFLSNIASSENITLEAMKWSPLSVPSDAVATKADSSSWSLSKSDSLAVRASVGIDVGDELQPLSARWRIVGDREESGWLQLGSRFDALPGTYTLEFQVVDGYNAPVPRNLELVGGVNYDIPASYLPMLAYKIGAIPPIYARQGDDYQIFIQRTYTSGQRTIREPESPSISGEIDLDAQSGLFRYRPASSDREAFTLRFVERATDQPDVFQDVLVTPVATPARAELDSFHRPKATDRQSDFYLTLTDETIPFDAEEIPFFNGQARPDGLRRVTISGIDVVLDPDTAANSLWEAIHSSTAEDNNARIAELAIYAERLTIGGTLRVPQTNITIHARELVFQDADGKYASISTKPYTPLQQAGPIPPSRTVPMAHHGHKAGDISVLVESILVPGDSPTPRIIADGGDGAPATPGRNGTPGQAVALTGVCTSPEYQHIMFVGHWEDPISLPPLADPNNWGHWFNVKPNIMNGENAVIASPPGNGGNSGTITSTLEIAAFASSQGGVAGGVGAATQGGIRWSPGGNPGSGVPVYILRGCINMANHSFTQHWGTNGQDGPAPDASVQVGVSESPQLEPNKVAWLHPRALTNITLWLRDLYLNRGIDEVRTLTTKYLTIIDAVGSVNGLDPDIQLLYGELQELHYRASNGVDYFGNPIGWVPALSLEANYAAFKNEVEASIGILYSMYWLRTKAETRAEKQRGIQATIAETTKQIQRDRDAYSEVHSALDRISSDALTIENDILVTQAEIQDRLQLLENDANTNVRDRNRVPGWKRAAKIVGTICMVLPIPAVQPALMAIGAGLTAVANAETNKPGLDNIPLVVGAVSETLSKYQGQDNQIDQVLRGFTNSPGVNEAGALFDSLQQFAGPAKQVLQETTAALKRVEAPQNEVEAELSRLAASDPAFNDLTTRAQELTQRRAELRQRIVEYQSAATELQNGIGLGLRAMVALGGALNEAGDFSHEADLYLKRIQKRSEDRLLKYQYWLAQAFEYRLLDDYKESFNLQRIADEFARLAQLPGEDRSTLTPQEFAMVRVVYEESLRETVSQMINRLNSEPPGAFTQGDYTLSPEELSELNGPSGRVVIDLAATNQTFGPRVEDVRLDRIGIREIEIERGPGNGTQTEFEFIHEGNSIIARGGRLYRFVHAGSEEGRFWNWTSRYRWSNGLVEDSELGILEASLIGTIIDSSLVDGSTRLFAMPGGLTKIDIRRTDLGGFLSEVKSLTLAVDFFGKSVSQNMAMLDFRQRVEGVDDAPQIMPQLQFSRADNAGRSSGYGDIRRIFNLNTDYTVYTEPEFGQYVFSHWEAQGVDLALGKAQNPTLQFRLNRSGSLTAVYKLNSDIGELKQLAQELLSEFVTLDSNNDGVLSLNEARGKITSLSQSEYDELVALGGGDSGGMSVAVLENVLAAGEPINLSVSPDSRNVEAVAGETTFLVSTNGLWSVSSDQNWAAVPLISNTGDGTLTVGYTANTSTSARTANITVTVPGATGSPKVVTVTQEGTTVTPTGLEGDLAPRPNGNGIFNTADVVQARRYVAGLDIAAAGGEFQRADCAPRGTSGDGVLASNDLTQVRRYVAGLDPQQNAGGPTSPAKLDVEAFQAFLDAYKGGRIVSVSGTSIPAGANGEVSIGIDAQGDETAVSFSVTFDPAQLTFVSAVKGVGLAADASLTTNANQAGSGRLGILIDQSTPLVAGSRELVKLTFTAAQTANTINANVGFGDTPVVRSASDAEANDLPLSFAGGQVTIQAGPVNRVVRAQNVDIPAGEEGQVAVLIASQGDETAVSFSVTFDPAQLTFVSAAKGTGLAADASLTTNASQAGSGRVGILLDQSIPLVAGTRQLLLLTFAAANVASSTPTTIGFGDTPVVRSASDAEANDLPVNFAGGEVTIEVPTILCTLSVSGGATSIPAAGGTTAAFNVDVTPNTCAWTVTAPGATLSRAGATGDSNFTVTIGANNTSAARTIVVTVTPAGNAAGAVVRNITQLPVEDCTPVITLIGANPLTVQCGATFNDPGATESCNNTAIAGTGNVNTSVVGTYTRTYAFSGATTVTRTVNVVDTTAPVITLNGSSTVTVNRGANCFTDPGATANDSCAGAVDVTVNGSVDCDTCGSYTLRYSATDAEGNTATRNRMVVVGGPACEEEGEVEGEGEGDLEGEGEGEEVDCPTLAPPGNIRAESSFSEPGRVFLSWAASANATGYAIYRTNSFNFPTGSPNSREYLQAIARISDLIGTVPASELSFVDEDPATPNPFEIPSTGCGDVAEVVGCISPESNPGCYITVGNQAVEYYYVVAIHNCGAVGIPDEPVLGLSYKVSEQKWRLNADMGLLALVMLLFLGLSARMRRYRKGVDSDVEQSSLR